MIEEGYTRTLVLGLARPLVLWLLHIKPRSGYELMSEIKRLTGMTLGPALIYPFLHALEKSDCIAGRWFERAGRKVRCYSITRKGEAVLGGVRHLFRSPMKEMLLDLLR